MNYRFVLPTLAATAFSFATAAGAQATQKKPVTPTTRTAPATTAPAQKPVAAQPAAPVEQAPAPAAALAPKAEQAADVKATKPAPISEKAHFGIVASVAAPMSSLGQTFAAGWNAGVLLQGKPAALPVGLRGDLTYTNFPKKETGVVAKYTVIQLTGAAIYDFPNSSGGKSPFFASGGLGLYRWKPAGSVGQTDFGQNLGLGFNVRTKFKPFFEGRFHFFNNLQYFTLTGGVRL